ncbi:unnamed protein product (macronuclear) [Paramecium tetraurelia]|uniref:Uncharacterized protein n=1 Tax=Paramecium tetraurelia TaxID=5888 RepID=A0CQ29_PARTE|nr:uncharacterized protein GSPATT00009244001 [Paramecium tetraurelia]CAK72896.1 unnamed protein product [Paramecium tetraurelia]|eukprot:XP_001440293.1 hypothetical protein (macronuclear) [Paramecium tetraurelia strain d4-2]
MILQSQEAIREKENDEEVTKHARQLKKKVINSLENYSQMLTSKDNSIKKVIKNDLNIINQEYQELLSIVDEVELISNEVQMIIKLVGEFLEKMSVKSNEKREIQYSKTMSEKLQRNPTRSNTFQGHSYDCYQKQRSFPSQQLQQQQQLSNNSCESDENTAVSNKTLSALNSKICTLIQQLQQNEKYQRITHYAQEIMNSSENMETFKQLRQLSKQFDDPEVKKLVKVCYLKSLVQEQSQNNTSKREFYDLVIKIKSQVPENNKIHSMMINSLYDDVVKNGVPNTQWEAYMKQLFK